MRAFVVGNIALDETIRVADLPSPGASIHGQEISRDLGGKGANQAIVLGRAGVPCRLVAAVGQDARAAEIRERLAGEPVDADLVLVPGVASDLSIVLTVEGGENCVVTTSAAASSLGSRDAVARLSGARKGDLLVLQGNLAGPTTRDLLVEGRRLGLVTVLNPSPLRTFLGALWPLVDIVCLNRGEAEALGGTDALRAAGVGTVVLTLGAAGSVLLRRGEDVRVPAHPGPVIDPTGAGDSFLAAALASAARRGVPLDALALSHGARAATLTVGRPGTVRAFPTSAELVTILAGL
jgi:ribokinase